VRLERRLLVPFDLPGGAMTERSAAVELKRERPPRLGGEARLDLTDAQRRAIERRDGSLFVSAGAGSGKTRVLVERFVRAVVDDGTPVERILAITFTEKAAGELKARIRRRLVELGARDRARQAEGAWISTIHGFCARLLRTHPLEAGIDPEFRVLDDPTAARIAIDAFDRALEEFLADTRRGERLDLVASYTPDKLERMVRTVYARLRTRGQRRPQLPPLDPPQPGDARERLESAVAAAQRALSAAPAAGAVDAALAKLDDLAEALSRLAPGTLGDPDELAALAVRRGNARALRIAELDELETTFERWTSACAAAKAYADYVLLARLLDLHGRRYEQAKGARSALDFDDLELVTRDLMAGDRRLREAVAGRFDHVMVDEHQDTNPLQSELIELVARDNLFAVGDEFQSIYGFRGADVAGFRRRGARERAAGRAEGLRTSFRMGPELVATVNGVFGPLFGEGYAPLESAPGRVPDDPSAPPRVELLAVDRSSRRWIDALGEDAFGDSMRRATPWRAAEARLVAQRVAELVAGGRRPGDIALLVRAATDLDAYERALEERGIPTYAAGAAGYWRRQEIADLRAYLAALANPRDELSLDGVLASPLVGVSLDALALIHRCARAERRDIWWALEDAFAGDAAGDLTAELPPAERERLGAFVRWFARERREAPRLSLETLIDRAVSATGYDLAVLARPDGARRLANVRKLMRLAREFEAEAGRDVRGLIDFVDEHELVAAREAEAPLEAEGLDAVRLMTIHAAKGLEFPLVVVADLGRDGRADSGALRVSDDGRVGLEVASLTGRRDAGLELEQIKRDQECDADAEERRIFYVAMTRAQERLILSGAVDSERWPEPRPLGAPIDWLHRALAPGMEGGGDGGIDTVPGAAARTRWTLLTPANVDDVLPPAARRPAAARTASGQPAPAARAPTFEAVAAREPLPFGRLSYSALEAYKRCAYRFYLERVAGMRPTQPIVRAEVPATSGQLPLAAPDAGALAPLTRGTIVHQLLERIDLVRPLPPDADAVVARARANAVEVTAEQAAEIAALVGGFLASPLAQRIRRAARVRREVPFAFALDPGRELLINGVIDVYAEEADGVLIVDYKTDPLGGEPAAVSAERYSTQRLVYALAALRSGAARVEVAYAFLERPDEPVVDRYEPADAARLEQSLLALAADLLAGRFEPTDNPHRELCQFCPAQPALCSWGPERTLADPAG
jgi:ATP-dependent helicase/nuclease subunit A